MADELTNDPVIDKALLYGETAGGVPKKLRVTDDGATHVSQATLTSGEDQTNNVVRVEGQFEYETVAAGQTTQALGTTGAVGDLLHSIIITASTGTITVLDGVVTVAVIPAAATGVWLFDAVSVSGAWNITTAAATSCTVVGRFS